MSRCGWCGADSYWLDGCLYGCEEECVCGSAVGDCHRDGPCPDAEEFDRRTIAGIAEYGRRQIEAAAVAEAVAQGACGG